MMDSSNLETEIKRFIDAVFRVGGEWLEPEHWVFPCFDSYYHVTFVAKAPYAYHASAAYKQIMGLQWKAPIDFEIWSQGASKPDNKKGLISALQRYRFQSLSSRKTDSLLYSRSIYIDKQIFNNIALEQLAADDCHRFTDLLLLTHREILEAGGIAIDDDKIRLYCRSKEEAIALNHGKWDLIDAAIKLKLPEQIEIYYHTGDQGTKLYNSFSIQEAQLAARLHRRELKETFQKLDIADNL